jgi:hypothetical protein
VLERLLQVALGTAALIGLLWLAFTENYEGMLILFGVCVLVLFGAGAFLYIAAAPRDTGLIEKARQRRSARAITKELLTRIARK